MTTSSLPSPLKSATATDVCTSRWRIADRVSNVPSPRPGRTSTVWPPVTRSGMPSPVKSPTATARGELVAIRRTACQRAVAVAVASTLSSRMSSGLTTSRLPSALRSATASRGVTVPRRDVATAAKPPAAVAQQHLDVTVDCSLGSSEVTTRSILPSPLKSAAAIDSRQASREAGVTGGRKVPSPLPSRTLTHRCRNGAVARSSCRRR